MEALRVLNSRYQLLAVIKRGGFGTIYKGYDSVLGKEIAVKEINPDLLDEAWYIDQFQNEARHVAKMNHQNIVHIFDLVKTEDRRFYIVMEYIDGLDLNRLLQACAASGRRLPQHLAIHIVAEICKALDYAHNLSNPETHEPLNLVHQDISPSNIMISKHGVVKLIDFGIAGAQRKPGTGDGELALQGKLPYMSPEHVAPEYSLDNRSDIFSLGLVLYEVLEGKRFFHEEQGTEIIEALRNGKLKLKDLHHTPKPLQPILERALEKSPENRYQNANQFYIDLVTYFVLNADTTNIDEELGQFVARCAEVAGSPRNGSFDIRDDWPHYEPFPAAEERHDPPDKPDLLSWDGEKQNGSRDHETPSLVPTPVSAPTEQESLKVEGLEANVEPRDEVKTVIDAVRLATRGHGKLVARIGIGVLAAGLLFLLLDVAFRWTALGVGVYDWLFPPAIKIASVPAGAKVYLDNKPLDRVTPLSIDEIEPGVHELKLSKAQYAPVIKSIYVPGNGDVQIKGAQGSSGGRLYTFHFKTTLYLTSTPPGAAVLINGLKFGKRTPCS
ncbi:MAG: PEGA domain-containing protein, partial [Calditrichaeota bacterium]